MSTSLQLAALPAKTPVQVLAELARQLSTHKEEALAFPELTLLLRNGHRLTGRLLAFEPRKASIHGELTLHLTAERYDMDVAYLPSEELVAVVVHLNAQTLPRLAFGQLPPAEDAVPTKLQLQRLVKNLEQELTAKLQQPITITAELEAFGEKLAGIIPALEGLKLVLQEVAADAEGRAALQQQLQQVVLMPTAGEASLRLQQGTLHVLGKPVAGGYLFLPPAELKHQLERLL